MKKNIVMAAVIAVITVTSAVYSQNNFKGNLTLNDAIKLALKNQPLINQAEQQVNAAEAKVNIQKSFDYPDVQADLSYIRIGPISTIQFGNESFILAPANNYDAHVSVGYNIFDFGRKSALLDLTKSYKLTAQEKTNYIKDELSYNTTKLFYSILYLEKSLDVKNDQIKTLETHLDVTQKKVDSGTATDFEVLTTKVRVASAENQKVDIENEINKQKIALNSLMGLPADSPLDLQGDLSLLSMTINNDSLLELAYSQREELKIAQDAQRSIEQQKQVASLSNVPTLNAIASYGLKNGFMPNLDVLRGNWVVGISANIPIFNGNRKDAQIQEAQANLNANDAQISALKRKINMEVQQAVSDLETSKAKLKSTQLQVEQAAEAVKRAEVSYINGVITNLDLLDAETSLSEAKLLHLRVIYQNVVNAYNLKEAVGDVIR
jgi:outer membrane protein